MGRDIPTAAEVTYIAAINRLNDARMELADAEDGAHEAERAWRSERNPEPDDAEVEAVCEECGELHYPHQRCGDVLRALSEPDVEGSDRG